MTWSPAPRGCSRHAPAPCSRSRPARRCGCGCGSRAEGAHDQWVLAFTNPPVDQVDVWQLDERGRWRVQSAGDLVAVDNWPERGRYPVFRLELPAGQARDVFLRVQGTVPASVPLQLRTAAVHSQRLQAESLGLGTAFGAMLLLVAACLAQSWAYRDRAYGWYAAFTAVTTLNLLAYSGVAAHLLWPTRPDWADAAPGALAFLSGGASMLFVRRLTGIAARSATLDRLASSLGWGGLPLCIAYVLAPRPSAMHLLSAFLAAAVLLNMAVAWLSWRRRDVVGFWVLLACLPLTLAVLLAVLRWLGFLPISFATQYAAVVAVVLQVPLLLVALSIRSRDRHGAQIREQALSSQDALTGLLAPHLFRDRLHQVVARFKRDREDAAVVFIDLVNHARIRAAYGSAVAEQSVLRSVIKLRHVVRDVDTVGRIGEARFGLILEGATSRTAVTQRAARLIAAGLMPLQGLKPDVTLHFHVAGVLLREHNVDADDLPHLLGELLASMSPRTRRPIRFLVPEETQPVPLDPDSELPIDSVPAPVR
ncbi:MAG: sensor domain-containing diguanylate cyclase [Ramlibacter sp.]